MQIIISIKMGIYLFFHIHNVRDDLYISHSLAMNNWTKGIAVHPDSH